MPRVAIFVPAWVRITHWLNVIAVVVLVMSGWRIYNASPLFPFRFPEALTLGGWLAGALLWHFAAMWLLVLNGLAWLIGNLVTGRLRSQFFPIPPAAVWHDFRAALRGRLTHEDLRVYNTLQKLAYLFVALDIFVIVLSGLVVWKSVQFAVLRELLGGYESARLIHFSGMALLVAFTVVHLVMVAIVPRTLLLMTRGH